MAAATKTLAQALLDAQAGMPAIQKSAINPHFRSRFVPLDGLLEQVLPVLNEHGLVLSQSPTTLENGTGPVPALRTRLIHAASGDSIEDVMLLMVAKDDPQGQGSAITYARRYALMAVLGLVADEDDDGSDDDGSKASRGSGRSSTGTDGQNGESASREAADSPTLSTPLDKPATAAQVAEIEALLPALAGLRGVSETEAHDAFVAAYGPIPEFNQVFAREQIGKLKRAKTTAEKAKA